MFLLNQWGFDVTVVTDGDERYKLWINHQKIGTS